MLHMAIHVDYQQGSILSIKFEFQIQFVMFLRGHPGTPIDPAPVLLSGIHCSTSHVETGGKPSTWFPPGRLVEHIACRRRFKFNICY